MKHGKKICDQQLRKVRKEIAEANGIDYQPHECTHTGDCLGTCPRCESEVRELTLQLQKRHKAAKLLRVAGVAIGAISSAAMMTSCAPIIGGDPIPPGEDSTYMDTTIYENSIDELPSLSDYLDENAE